MRARTPLVATLVLLAPLAAAGQRLPLRASLHAGNVSCRDASGTFTGTPYALGVDPGSGLELAIAYRLTPVWEVELAAFQAGLDISASSPTWPTFVAGGVDVQVTTLALQYRFFTTGRVTPYVGLGGHLASFSGFDPTADLQAAGIATISFSDTASVTAHAGAAFHLTERFSLDLRATYHDVATDAAIRLPGSSERRTLRLDVDPWTVAAGVDFRF